jgi:signal transduction histidine kinase
MVRLGEMTAGAAHEMNNPLTVIRGRAQILADSLADERDRATAQRIAAAASDLSDLVTTLHRIAKPGEADRRPTSLREVLEAAAALGAPGDAGVRIELPHEPLMAAVDGERLARGIAELIRNARDWAPEGIVRVRVQIEAPDDRLVIRVEDDGPGLSARAQRHAFDPFFSERPAGRGRGLGLPLAKRLVELHGGTLRLEPGGQGGTVAMVGLEGWRPSQGREVERAA